MPVDLVKQAAVFLPRGELQGIQVPSSFCQGIGQTVDIEDLGADTKHTHLGVSEHHETIDLAYPTKMNRFYNFVKYSWNPFMETLWWIYTTSILVWVRLTYCSLVMPYGDKDLGQHQLR